MATIKLSFLSKVLQRTVNVDCYLPNDLKDGSEIKGVITLLHGFSDSSEAWLRNTSAYRYAADNHLCIICPAADNSFYTDLVYGGAYYTYFTEELPQYLQKTLSIPADREKNMIAGLSMGGYGALLLGMSQPDRYFACASFSGALMVQVITAEKENPEVQTVFCPIFGTDLIVEDKYDLVKVAEKLAELPQDEKIKLYVSCGLQDETDIKILTQNKYFENAVSQMDIDCEFEYWNGAHEWSFWDRSLVKTIDKFFNKGYLEQIKQNWI